MKTIQKKDGSTVYRASVYLGIDQVTGKKVKTSVTGRTKKEVKQKAKEAERNFQTSGSTRYKAVKVSNYQELADLWLESYKLTVKPQTYYNTQGLIKKYLSPTFGTMQLSRLSTSFIQGYLNGLASKVPHFGVIHSINRRILQFGVSMQVIPYNPAREIVLPKRNKQPPKESKFIDPVHLKLLLSYMEEQAKKQYDYFFFHSLYNFLLATGCRIGEASALEWSDIDLKNGTVSIDKTYNNYINQTGTPKSHSGVRTISIDQKTMRTLKLYQNRQRLLYLEVGRSAPVLVFSTPTKKRLTRNNEQALLTRHCQEAGIPRFTFHAFRHTHASLLLNAGISYKELQHRLGHSTLAMTMDIYGHITKEKEKEAVFYFEKAIENL